MENLLTKIEAYTFQFQDEKLHRILLRNFLRGDREQIREGVKESGRRPQ